MTSKQNTGRGDELRSAGDACQSLWLGGWLFGRPALLARAVSVYQQLKRQPKAWRRRLVQSAAVSLGGVALLLALSIAPVSSNSIIVADGEVEIADNGKCSLIEAIRNANNKVDGQPHDDCAAGNPSGADTITLPKGGEFVLTGAHNTGEIGGNGLPWIGSNITIRGRGSTIRRDLSGPEFRILAVGPMGDLTLERTSLVGGTSRCSGDCGGGGVLNQGRTTIDRSMIRNCDSVGDYSSGGGIFNQGEMIVLESTLRNNSASESGGAIDNRGTLEVVESTLSNNHTGYYDGLGGAVFNDGDLTITGSVFEQNEVRANFDGGGGAIFNSGQLVLKSSTLSGNSVSGRMAWGGAVHSGGPLTLHNVSLLDNEAYGTDGAAGGGLNAEASTTITRSTIARNSVTVGDPSRPAEANLGGGISSNSPALSISDTTLSDNSATVGGGLASRSEAVLTHTTISGNRGGGVWAGCRTGRDASLTLLRNLISGNEDGEVAVDRTNGCDVALNVNGHNLFGTLGDAGVNFDLGPTDFVPDVGIDKILAPLADNGGPTWTHALVRRSPAIDAAPSAACEGLTDQRGYPRNVDGDGRPSSKECDVGAFEYGAEPPATSTPTPEPSPTQTNTPTVTPTVEPSATPTSEPSPTATFEPTATATAEPTPTMEPSPTPTLEPSPSETPEAGWCSYLSITFGG